MSRLDPFKRTERALSTFRKAMTELDRAAADHYAVADEAYARSTELTALAAENKVAALTAERRASKIRELLS